MGLIEDNEINNNTLAGVWITTGITIRLEKYAGGGEVLQNLFLWVGGGYTHILLT